MFVFVFVHALSRTSNVLNELRSFVCVAGRNEKDRSSFVTIVKTKFYYTLTVFIAFSGFSHWNRLQRNYFQFLSLANIQFISESEVFMANLMLDGLYNHFCELASNFEQKHTHNIKQIRRIVYAIRQVAKCDRFVCCFFYLFVLKSA